jgi:hypothetical protein
MPQQRQSVKVLKNISLSEGISYSEGALYVLKMRSRQLQRNWRFQVESRRKIGKWWS